MNRILFIFVFTILLTACSNQPEGHWRLNFDEEVENHLLPYELSFQNDTLLFVDGFNFKQTSIFKIEGDSISVSFKDGTRKNYLFTVLSDSSLEFENRKYFRTSKDYFSKTEFYEVLGWTSTNKFIPLANSATIHLIKDENDSAKVILNDITTNLNYLPEFLNCGHGQKPKIYLYLGKGIELKDLLEAYCWIKYSHYLKVELVTSNISFEKFNSIQDYADVDDDIYSKFLAKNRILPPPPPPVSNSTYFDVYVDSATDLDATEFNDITFYMFNFSDQLNIHDYLELTKRVNRIANKRKRLTTTPKLH